MIMDPRKIRLKKSIKFPKLKEVKERKDLPNNKGIMNVFKTAKGMPVKPNNKVVNAVMRPNGFSMGSMRKKPMQDTYGRTMRFKNDGRVSRQELRSVAVGSGRLGMQRVKKQKGLRPWGDSDGDGLINMLDCDPLNKDKQSPAGAFDDAVDDEDMRPSTARDTARGTNGRGGRRSPSPERFDPEAIEERRRAEDDIDMTVESVESGRFRDGADEQAQAERAGSGFSAALGRGIETLGRGIARERRLSERRRIDEQDLRAKAARQATADEERRRQRQLLRIARERERETTPQSQAIPQAIGGAFGTLGQVSRESGGIDKIRQGATMPGSQERILMLTSPQRRTMATNGREQPVMRQPQPQPQPRREVQRDRTPVTPQEAMRDPDKEIQSPYSGRKVSYVRGPYKTGGDD